MKQLQAFSKISILFALLLSVDFAAANEFDSTILLSRNDQSVQSINVMYPGSGRRVVDGVIIQDYKQPDCLVLHNGQSPINSEYFKEIASEIIVRDTGVILEASNLNGTVVYYINNLSTYVTSIGVQAKSAETLGEAVDSVIQDGSLHNILIEYSSGCQLVGR